MEEASFNLAYPQKLAGRHLRCVADGFVLVSAKKSLPLGRPQTFRSTV